MKYLLDTHTWIWWNARPDAISVKIRRLLANPAKYDELLLSAISVWELCKLLERGRLGLSLAPEEWIAQALDMPGLRLVPLSPRIAYQSTVLPTPFQQDPADQIIVATAREENATILTRDERILNYRHVQALW